MADSYTKLFNSILASTIWQEPDTTRLTWIAMLAMADQNGVVVATVPGLAHFARVSLVDCEAAIATLSSPDKYSRTPDDEGRRIERVDDGWRLLNHALYRGRSGNEARREYQRKWDQENRPRRNPTKPDTPTVVVSESDEKPSYAEAEANTDKSIKATVRTASAPTTDSGGKRQAKTAARFPEFWAAYPNKKGNKAGTEKKWRTLGLDEKADQIIAHIRLMEREDSGWQRGFIPMAATYVNQQRWTDVPQREQGDAKPHAPLPPAESFGPKAALAPTEDPLTAALEHAKQRYNLGEFGTGSEGMAAYAAEQRSIRQRLAATGK